MERYRQRQLQIQFRQCIDLRHNAAGGQADVPHTDIQAFRTVDQFQEFKDIVLIIQRLANAHENDVGDIQSAVQLGEKHLIQYFRRC